MLRRTPLKRTSPIKARRKAKPPAERAHHARVASLPCIACGAWPVEVHHIRFDGRHAITRNHRLVVPLCPAHHREGPDAVHATGHPAFNALFGVDQMAEAERLWAESEK